MKRTVLAWATGSSKGRKAEKLVTTNTIVLMLVLMLVLTSFVSCARYMGSRDTGLDNFRFFLEDIDSVLNGAIESFTPYLDEDSAIVFFNKGTSEISLTTNGEEAFSVIRPGQCEDMQKSCICYLSHYDEDEEVFSRTYCEQRSFLVKESSLFPVEIYKDESFGFNACKDFLTRRFCNELSETPLSEITDAQYSQEGSGVFIDRGLTNGLKRDELQVYAYRHEDEIVLCHDRDRCIFFQDQYSEEGDGSVITPSG